MDFSNALAQVFHEPITKNSVRISERGSDLIEDFGDAYARLTISPKDSQEARDAFAALQQRKLELYQYIGSIERVHRTPQIVKIIPTVGRR